MQKFFIHLDNTSLAILDDVNISPPRGIYCWLAPKSFLTPFHFISPTVKPGNHRDLLSKPPLQLGTGMIASLSHFDEEVIAKEKPGRKLEQPGSFKK